MSVSNKTFKSIKALQQAIASEQVTFEQVTSEYLQAIERSNPEINAFTTINERAVEEARALETSSKTPDGSLFGLPIAIKEAIETAGLKTSFGSNGCKDHIPKQDATVVQLLRESGAVVTGKTTCPDWCLGFLSHSSRSGITKNPYDLSRDPGGSSSGSAAAVASGMAVAAIGTDTAGSIRIPGAFNGLVGVMLTPGRVSRAGVSPMITNRDTVCPIAHTVEDCAQILDVVVAYDPRDPATSINYTSPLASSCVAATLHPPEPKTIRLGVLKSLFGTHKNILSLLSDTLSKLSSAGITLIDIPEPSGLAEFRMKTFVPEKIEPAINQFLSARPDLSQLSFRDLPVHELNLLGPAMLTMNTGDKGGDEARKAEEATELEREWKQKFGAIYAEHRLDGIVFPTTTCLAPKIQDVLDRNVNVFNLAGSANTDIANSLQWPAMTVPIGKVKDEDGEGVEMPVGLDLLGMPLRDAEMVGVGAAIEKALMAV